MSNRPPHTWEQQGPLGPAPAAFLTRPASRRGPAAPVEETIGEGGRHRELVKIAGIQRRAGLTGNEIAVTLLTINRERCKPPLPDNEVVDIAHDVARRYQPDPERAALRQRADDLLTGKVAPPAQEAPRRPPRQKVKRRAMRSVIPLRAEWVIPGFVPLGTITMIAGVGGLGKSALSLAWAATITNEGHDVLIVSYEDDASRVLRPRFEAVGGNLDRLHELYVEPEDGLIQLPGDLTELTAHVAETRARLLIIDPVSASIDLNLDAHRDQHVRVIMGALERMAARHDMAVLLVAHLNKVPSNDAYLRINGSTGFYNASRSVLTVTPDMDDDSDEHRLVAQHKHNYGVIQQPQRWVVMPVTLTIGDLELETMRLEYLEVAEDVKREDVLSTIRRIGKIEVAEAYLLAALSDGEWHERKGLEVLARAQGISEGTLERAARKLDVESERRGFPSTSWWRMDVPTGYEYSPDEDE